MIKAALYPGSFDPFTRGHRDIVDQGVAKGYDITVGIGENAGKGGGLFAPQERVRIAQKALQTVNPKNIVRIAGSTARYARRMDISTILRGQRNIVDEVTETAYAELSKLENPELSFEVFEANGPLKNASSSAAKELVKIGHDPSALVTLAVHEALTSRLLSQYPVYITGGMGAGKSTIAKKLTEEAKKYHIPVRHIELDTIAHDIYESLTDPYYQNIRKIISETFGGDVTTDADWIDRAKLAERLFATGTREFDKDKLEQLNTIISPAIRFRYQDMIEGFRGIILVDGVIRKGGIDDIVRRYAHNHTLLVDANVDDRVSRVMGRYNKKGAQKSEGYVRSMFDFQGTIDDFREILDDGIAHEGHGDRLDVDNSGDGPEMRKIFFRLLNQIDTYGELRAEWILRNLEIKDNIRDIISNLQKSYNHPSRYYHTWEHIVESLTILFDIAIEMDLSDEDIAIIGGAILGHDLIYRVDAQEYFQNESASARQWSKILESHGVNTKYLESIEDLIRETRHGRVKISDTLQSQVMHDVDMAILGSDQSRYAQYARDLQPEFRPMASGTEFERLRREKFLLPVLNNGFRYKTSYAQERFGARVKENLKWELENQGNI